MSSASILSPQRVGPSKTYESLPVPSRRYNRKHDNPIVSSPMSEVIDADDESLESDWSEPVVVRQRIYESPRCVTDDALLFPTDPATYRTPKQRWQRISEQAGSHRQDGKVLVLPARVDPIALRFGVTPPVAARVRSLNLCVDRHQDNLPEWLDMVSSLFANLKHLTISHHNAVGESEVEVSDRMRRLYVLYRLPHLQSIDDKPVTKEERKLARPATPNGARVQRNDWMGEKSSLLDGSEDEEDHSSHADSDSPSESGYITRADSIGNHTAQELCMDLAELAQQVACIHENEPEKTSLGEQREDLSSHTDASGNGRENDFATIKPCLAQSLHSKSSLEADEVELMLADDFHAVKLTVPPPIPSTTSSSSNSTQSQDDAIPNQTSLTDTLDLVSVASSHHEWSATCGVLTFQSDGTCAPRVRLNFCGSRPSRISTNRLRKGNNSECRPVQRQSALPLGPKLSLNGKDTVENETGPSANQKVPPSKSLTSPFPMQFRERSSPLRISTQGDLTDKPDPETTVPSGPRACGTVPMDTITKPITLTVLNKAPAAKKAASGKTAKKGDLPPPCPAGPGTVTRRKVGASSLLQHPNNTSRKARKLERRKKAFQKTARTTSVMDDLEEDDSNDSPEEDENVDRYVVAEDSEDAKQ